MIWMPRRLKRQSKLIGDEKRIFKVLRHRHFDYGDMAVHNLRDTVMKVDNRLPHQFDDARPMDQDERHRLSRHDRLEKKHRQHLHPISMVDWFGMRASTAIVFLAVAAVAFMFLFLNEYSMVSDAQKQVDSLNLRKARSEEKIQTLEQEFDTAAANINVAYEAKNLGLISSKGVPIIELSVPGNVVINPADAVLELPSDTLATILGD